MRKDRKHRKEARRERVTRLHEVKRPAEQAKTRGTPPDRQQIRPAETDRRPRKHGEKHPEKGRHCLITANSGHSAPQSTPPGLQLARTFQNALRALALPKIKSFKLQAYSTPKKTISISHTSSHTFPLLYFSCFPGAILLRLIPPYFTLKRVYFFDYGRSSLTTATPLSSTIPLEIVLWCGFRGFFCLLPYFSHTFCGRRAGA